jgi:hypothetical protein
MIVLHSRYTTYIPIQVSAAKIVIWIAIDVGINCAVYHCTHIY